MNTSNIVFFGLIFLLIANGTITLTQGLLLLALLSTVICCTCNNSNNNFNFNNTTSS